MPADRLDIKLSLNLDILLNHEPSGAFGVEDRLFLRKKRGESMQHVAMKLLGWLMYWRDGLAIEMSADQHYKPDVVAIDDYGEPTVWIDCGSTSLKKLEKITTANPDTRFVIIKATPSELANYEREAIRRVPPDRVDYVTFDDHYVDRLAAVLHNRHRLVVTVPPNRNQLFVEFDGVTMNAEIVSR